MDLRWLGVNKSSVNKSVKSGESVQAQRTRIVLWEEPSPFFGHILCQKILGSTHPTLLRAHIRLSELYTPASHLPRALLQLPDACRGAAFALREL